MRNLCMVHKIMHEKKFAFFKKRMSTTSIQHTRPNSVRSIDKLKLHANKGKQDGGRYGNFASIKPKASSSSFSRCNSRMIPPMCSMNKNCTPAKCKIKVTTSPSKVKTFKSLPSHGFHIVGKNDRNR